MDVPFNDGNVEPFDFDPVTDPPFNAHDIDDAGIDSLTFLVTFFENRQAAKQSSQQTTLPELAILIGERIAAKKMRLPWLKLSRFGDIRSDKDCLRTNANLQMINGIEVEHDACTITFETAVAVMRKAGIRCLIYTSPSWQEGVKEKWRILLPTSKELPPDQHFQLVARVHGLLGEGSITGECFTLSQAYLYGHLEGMDHREVVTCGDFIDQRNDLDAGAIGKPRIEKDSKKVSGNGSSCSYIAPCRSDEEIMELLPNSVLLTKDNEKQWHNVMLSATGSMVNRRWSDERIYDATAPYCDNGWGDPDVEVMVEGARKKWGIPEPVKDWSKTPLGDWLRKMNAEGKFCKSKPEAGGNNSSKPDDPAKDDGAPQWLGDMLSISGTGFGFATTIFTGDTGEDYGPYKSCKALLSAFLARCVKESIADEMVIGLCLGEHKFSKGLICSYCRENKFTREDLETRIKQTGEGARQATPQGTTISSEGLGAMTFEPIKYVIPDLIVEGLTLLAGKPKLGKSWLLMHAAIAVATGGETLGGIQCEQGDVLYCALEDNRRRLQSRLDKLLPGVPRTEWPPRLFLRTEMPRLTDGGLDEIRDWIKAATRPRLVVIDTLAMVRPAKGRDETGYDADYNAVKDLRTLAGEYGVAIVIVHHLRKAEADDAFDTVSGTLGLTGAPDSILVVRYDTAGVVLHGRGRDLVELEKALVFDKFACTWSIKGDADDVRRSAERDAILTALAEGAGDPLGARQVAEVIGMKAANVRKLLGKMALRGEIKKVGYGKYTSIGGPRVSKEFVEALHRAQANGGGKPEVVEAEVEAEPEAVAEAEAENIAAAE